MDFHVALIVTMGANIFVGLAVCSKKVGILNTATFDNVSMID